MIFCLLHPVLLVAAAGRLERNVSMSARLLLFAGVIGILSGSTGCALFEGIREANRQTMRALKPRPTDYSDPAGEASLDWVQDVGREARGDRPLEQDPDPAWLQKLFKSPKHRDIERNMGIGSDF